MGGGLRSLVLFAIALGIVRYVSGSRQMSEEAAWGISSLIALVVVIFGVFVFSLMRAPVFLRFEKEKEPCLEVLGLKKHDWGLAEDGFNWGLRVKNVGLGPARGCECLLQQIQSAYHTGRLSGHWPTEVPFYWQGQREFPHVIQGGQTNRLQVIYHNYAGPAFGMAGPIILGFRSNNLNSLLGHDLSEIHEPILLLFSLVSEGKSAQYVLCRIDLDALVEEPVQPEPCTMLYVGIEEPNLADYLETRPNDKV